MKNEKIWCILVTLQQNKLSSYYVLCVIVCLLLFFAEELFQTLLDLSRLPEESVLASADEANQFRTSLPGMGTLQETSTNFGK